MVHIAAPIDKALFLKQLFIDNYADMVNFANAFFSNIDIAEDAVQDTFVIAQKKIDDLIKSPNPEGWLMNTLKNVNGNIFKRQKRLVEMFVPLNDTNLGSDEVTNIQFEFDGIISGDELCLLFWIYCDGMSYQQAADILGINLSACKKRIQRAKMRFKQATEK